MQLNPNPFVVMPVQRATQQYKQNWVVRLKKVVDLESGSEEISRNGSVDAADAVDVKTKTHEKNSTKSAGLLFRENLKDIGWWKAARHDDVVHMKRILNQPEFQTSRTKLNYYDVKTRMEITPTHCVPFGSFKVVLLLLRRCRTVMGNGSAGENAFQIAKGLIYHQKKDISVSLMNSYISDLKQRTTG